MSVQVQHSLPGVTIELRYAGFSDRGTVRTLNEDSFLAQEPYWVVADGMGGHAFGDRASQAAIRAFEKNGMRHIGPDDVLRVVREANEAVLELGGEALSGTTLTGVALVDVPGSGPHWMTFNVGDSRTYSWDGRVLSQQSVDHSAVQELIDRGRISRTEAAEHPERNVVTRALGAETEVEADVWLVPVRGHQTFVLCSDGLTKELDDDEIARIIVFHDGQVEREGAEALTLAERLGRAAIAAGGRDNVTVVVVEAEVVGAAPDDAGDTLDRRLLEDTRPRI